MSRAVPASELADFIIEQLANLYPNQPMEQLRLLGEILGEEVIHSPASPTDRLVQWLEALRGMPEAQQDEAARRLRGIMVRYRLKTLEGEIPVLERQLAERREEWAAGWGVKEAYLDLFMGVFVCFGPVPGVSRETREAMNERTGALRPAEKLRYLAGASKSVTALIGPSTPDRGTFARRAHEFIRHPRIAEAFDLYYRDEQVRTATAEGEELFAFYAAMLARLHAISEWGRTGHNVFELTHALAVGLALTDAPDDAVEASPLPFPAMVLRVPPGVLAFDAERWVDTVWLLEFDAEADNGARSVEEIVTVRQREVVALHDGEALADDAPEQAAVRNLVSNFLLWLEATGGHRAHKQDKIPPRLAEKRARSGETWPREWVFGRGVTIAPEMKRAAAERQGVAGWKVRARFIVRGHWRNQAHGPGRTQRTRKWIQPFWKGPKGEAAWSHLYVAKEES